VTTEKGYQPGLFSETLSKTKLQVVKNQCHRKKGDIFSPDIEPAQSLAV
jgi:hypothetical protein